MIHSGQQGRYVKRGSPLWAADTGYTAVCPLCAVRYNAEESMLGGRRDIVLVKCRNCHQPKLSSYQKRKQRAAVAASAARSMCHDYQENNC